MLQPQDQYLPPPFRDADVRLPTALDPIQSLSDDRVEVENVRPLRAGRRRDYRSYYQSVQGLPQTDPIEYVQRERTPIPLYDTNQRQKYFHRGGAPELARNVRPPMSPVREDQTQVTALPLYGEPNERFFRTPPRGRQNLQTTQIITPEEGRRLRFSEFSHPRLGYPPPEDLDYDSDLSFGEYSVSPSPESE